jgi:predicted nucleic acid-binding Zn ribbon protein
MRRRMVARPRICLLKGCGKWFCPVHPRSRYCSDACREAARKWSVWEAARRYRATEHGKQRRREQSCRYRQRVRERQGEAAGEGHQKADDSEKIPCFRPGCYELFLPEPRSPLKKFCCALCREALRRVRQREARWGWRQSNRSEEERWRRFRGPPEEFL